MSTVPESFVSQLSDIQARIDRIKASRNYVQN